MKKFDQNFLLPFGRLLYRANSTYLLWHKALKNSRYTEGCTCEFFKTFYQQHLPVCTFARTGPCFPEGFDYIHDYVHDYFSNRHKVLVIPSGELMGDSGSEIIKQSLKNYVDRGGVILCLAQQYDFDLNGKSGRIAS